MGESGMRRNARFSLGQARGQALRIPTWALHTSAFILFFALHLAKAVINDMAVYLRMVQIASGVNPIIWCYLGDQQLAGADEQWRVSDRAFYAAHDYVPEKPHINRCGEECRFY